MGLCENWVLHVKHPGTEPALCTPCSLVVTSGETGYYIPISFLRVWQAAFASSVTEDRRPAGTHFVAHLRWAFSRLLGLQILWSFVFLASVFWLLAQSPTYPCRYGVNVLPAQCRGKLIRGKSPSLPQVPMGADTLHQVYGPPEAEPMCRPVVELRCYFYCVVLLNIV